MSANSEHELDMIAQAAAGHAAAQEYVLWLHYDRLKSHLIANFPAVLRGSTDVEDLLQETLFEAWRHMGSFQPQGQDSFYRWLVTIADHKLQDKIKSHKAAKRGGGRAAAEVQADGSGSSVLNLLEVLAQDDQTPSKSAARHEAERALNVALAGLQEDYREAIRLDTYKSCRLPKWLNGSTEQSTPYTCCAIAGRRCSARPWAGLQNTSAGDRER